MDVYKLQRINNLASELKRHNFADSSEDAYQQAEQVYDETPVQKVVVEEPVVSQKTDALSERRFQMLFEQSNKKYDQEFALFRSALNTLAQEIESLKSELKRLSDNNPKPKERQEPLKTEVKEEHPRQGKFTPDDVDIQKMFYFGKK